MEDKKNNPNSFSNILFFICAGIFALALAFLIYNNISLRAELNKCYEDYNNQVEINEQLRAMIEGDSENTDKESTQSRGTKEELPQSIVEKIQGVTLLENSPVSTDDLVYLTIPYYNFDGETSIGHMIVNKDIADEVLDIFSELYNKLYPIQSIEIAENFDDMQDTLLNSTELASMGNNNTCALYYKKDGDEFSPHAYGMAIDINPKINPAVDENGAAIHRNAGKYLNGSELTDTEKWARIEKDSDVYNIFTKYGWIWDGDNGGAPFCFYKEF